MPRMAGQGDVSENHKPHCLGSRLLAARSVNPDSVHTEDAAGNCQPIPHCFQAAWGLALSNFQTCVERIHQSANSDVVPSESGSEIPRELRETGPCQPKPRTTCTSRPQEYPFSHVLTTRPAQKLVEDSHDISYEHPYCAKLLAQPEPRPSWSYWTRSSRTAPYSRGSKC